MAGKGVEVAVEVLHIDRQVGHALGAVDDDDGAVFMRFGGDLFDRENCAERIGGVGDGDDFTALGKQFFEFVEEEFARFVDGGDLDRGALFFGEHLPGDDIGVVLDVRNDNLISGADMATAIALGDEVDGLGGASHEDDLGVFGGVDKLADAPARPLVGKGRLLAEEVDAAMDIGVFGGVETLHGVDDGQRLLGSGAIVEIGQLLVADFLVEYGKVTADLGDVDYGGHSRPVCQGGHGAVPVAWSRRRATSRSSSSRSGSSRTRSRTSPAKARVKTCAAL